MLPAQATRRFEERVERVVRLHMSVVSEDVSNQHSHHLLAGKSPLFSSNQSSRRASAHEAWFRAVGVVLAFVCREASLASSSSISARDGDCSRQSHLWGKLVEHEVQVLIHVRGLTAGGALQVLETRLEELAALLTRRVSATTKRRFGEISGANISRIHEDLSDGARRDSAPTRSLKKSRLASSKPMDGPRWASLHEVGDADAHYHLRATAALWM